MASGCVACPKCSSDVFFTSVDQLNVPVLSPAVSSLLRTNDLPGSSVIHSLKESAQYIDAALGDVEADVHRLTDILSRLKEKRTLFRDAQNTHKTILSPIRRLHPDILVEIFLATGPSYLTERGAYNVFDVTSGPWLVGQVCSKWRVVVASHSALWSTMRLNVSWPLGDIFQNLDIHIWGHVEKLKGAIPLLSSALSRSGQHSLSFKFTCDNQTDTEILEIMSTLFHLLSSHCRRWENVSLRIPAPITAVLSSIRGFLPMLTDLELSFEDGARDDPPPLHIDAFSIAPRLARAQLIDVPEGIHVHLAKSSLVHFFDHRSGSAPTNTYLLDIIQTSSNLQKFWSRAAHGNQMADMPSARVVNTSLRELSACDGAFLGSLVLPALETISITPFSDEITCPPNTLPGLRTLLSQSRCSLTRLAMSHVTPDHHLFAVLELVPTLMSLAFDQSYRRPWPEPDGDVYQELISRMKTTSVDGSGQPRHLLLPSLEKLSFTIVAEPPRDSDFHSIVNHDFAEMVISRWDSYDEPSLSSVSVDFHSSLPWKLPGLLPDDIANLKRCKTEELDIIIRSHSYSGTIEFV